MDWKRHKRGHAQDKRVAAAALTAACFCLSGFAQGEKHDDDHSHHHAGENAASVTRLSETYLLPEVTLVRSDGAAVRFPAEIEAGGPIILNFIYTTCTAVCPLMSRLFTEVQEQLGEAHSNVHMVSISIDPEHDTPAKLAQHARKFGAGRQWQHYTGSTEASIAVQRAFKVYRGDKMSHTPATFVRGVPGQPWVRLEGFASAEEVVREYLSAVRVSSLRR